jgi:hypothetical protein
MRKEPAGDDEDDRRNQRPAEECQAEAELDRTAEQIAEIVDDLSGEVCVQEFHCRHDGASENCRCTDEEQARAPG